MEVQIIVKPAFTVIGMEGSTRDGDGFIAALWAAANARFDEIAMLCKRDAAGVPVGFWGAMSDFSRSFAPWQDFSQGLYLAGAECSDDAPPPAGWTRWRVPGYRYLRFDSTRCDFGQALAYMQAGGHQLAGAAQDFIDPATGKGFICLPIQRL